MVEHTLEMQNMGDRKPLKDREPKNPSLDYSASHDPRSSIDPSDEIDLVDLLGFFWRWRLWFVSFAFVGLVGANLLYYAFKYPTNTQVVPGIWDIKLEFSSNKDTITPASVAPFVTMLQSPQGAKLFKDLLLSQLPPALQEPLTQWHTQWLANPGKPQWLEINESGFVLHLEAPESLQVLAHESSIEQGFQNLLDKYAILVLDPFKKLLEKKTQTLRDLGSISFEAYRDFLSDGKFPPEMRRDFVAAIMKNAGGYLSLDQYTLILSGGSENADSIQKKMEKFQSTNQEFENIQSQIAQAIKTYSPAGPLPLEGTLKVAKTEFTPSLVPRQGINPIVKYNVLGFFLAMMLAMMGALVGQFYRVNKSRIIEILKSPQS
jgi:hypothetical protein